MDTTPASRSESQPNRRDFLKTATATALTVPLTAPIVHASDKTGSKLAIVGKGDFVYECHHDWGMASLPNGAHYGNASHGVAIDESGLIYVTHYGDPGSVFVFDSAGAFVKSLGDVHRLPNEETEQVNARGHGIDIRKEGSEEFIYLAASDKALDFVKLTLKGEVVWRKGRAALHEDSLQYNPGVPYRPTNTSFAPDGGYFLGDGYGNHMIHQYDRFDTFVRTIGGKGVQDGQFQTPHGQWLDTRDGNPKLVVADRANKRLQWFDMKGEHVKTLGGFLFPADIDIQGDVLMVPDLHCRITLLDKEDQVIVHLGEDPAWRKQALEGFKMRGQRDKWLPGKFVHPHDACFDHDGNIFVAEWVSTGRVTKLQKV